MSYKLGPYELVYDETYTHCRYSLYKENRHNISFRMYFHSKKELDQLRELLSSIEV